jgi:hypothetical protein
MAAETSDARLRAEIRDLAPRPVVGDLACAILSAILRLGEAHTRMLGREDLRRLAAAPCAPEDIEAAVTLLSRDEIGALEAFGMVHDPETDDLVEFPDEDFAEFRKSGLAVHPVSGEIVPGAAVMIFHASRPSLFDASPEGPA